MDVGLRSPVLQHQVLSNTLVSILVLMDVGLRFTIDSMLDTNQIVSILVLMDVGLR